MYSVGVITGILVVAAIIAFVGDVVGRRLGKLRLRLFGLRPRHTAMAMTVVTGMFIAGFTISTALALSQYARVGLLQVAELMRQQRELRIANQRLRAERERLRLAAEEAGRRGRRAWLRAKGAEQRMREAMSRLREVEGALKKVDTQRVRLQASLRRSLLELERLTEARRATEEEFKKALGRIRELHERISSLERERLGLEEERKRLSREVERLAREAGRLTELVREARRVLSEVRGRPITFRAGEALSMAVFEARVSEEDALSDLLDMLEGANTEAIRRGARVSQEGWALLFALPREEKTVPPEEAAGEVAKRLSFSDRSMVVRLVALTNCVEGEMVPVIFQLIPNRLIFREGEMVAGAGVEGNLPPEEIFLRLISLLKVEAGAEAERRGLLPQPPGLAGEEPFFGIASYREVFKAVEAIRKAGGMVKVKAVAVSDTYTIGPLEVRFVVEPLPR